MQVQHLNEWLVHVRTEAGDDLSMVFRTPFVTEVVCYTPDSVISTYIRVTRNPMICKFFDLNFMRITYRRCHVWFVKQEYKSKTGVACGEYPIPVDEEQFNIEDVTYKQFSN